MKKFKEIVLFVKIMFQGEPPAFYLILVFVALTLAAVGFLLWCPWWRR